MLLPLGYLLLALLGYLGRIQGIYTLWLGSQHLDNLDKYVLIVVSSREGLCLCGGCDWAGLFLVQD